MQAGGVRREAETAGKIGWLRGSEAVASGWSVVSAAAGGVGSAEEKFDFLDLGR